VLIGLIGREVAPIALAGRDVKPVPADDLDYWERKLEQELVDDPTVRETERQAIIRARNGQGLFRERVSKIESKCRITGVENPLRAPEAYRVEVRGGPQVKSLHSRAGRDVVREVS
jgi:hypothetical protein